jgi:glycosyltransferase involved in cell wall biosynthesis
MRILYLVHQFFPKHYTGTERVTLNIARQMQRMSHFPIVLTYETDYGEKGFKRLHDSVYVKRYTYDGVPVISIMDISLKSDIKAVSDGREGIFHLMIEKAFSKLRLEFDVLHVFHPMWLSSVAWSCKNHGIPIVLTLTDPWLLCPRETLIDRSYRLCSGPDKGSKCVSNCGYDPAVMTRYQESQKLLKMADAVVTASRFTGSLLNRNGYEGAIKIVPHSVDYQFVRKTYFDASIVKFGFIGSIVWHKGAHILVKAFRRVKSKTVRLHVYGSTRQPDPHYAKEVIGLAEGDNRIRFLGSFDVRDLPGVMNEISVLVVPSIYYENYPTIMLIALAYRIPVIASNIGGIAEVIRHGINGFLFETGNVDELAAHIEEIATRPEIISQLRSNITPPRRLEEEALDYENIYLKLKSK